MMAFKKRRVYLASLIPSTTEVSNKVPIGIG